ncbi:E3 ubiquitin-protein ligase RHA2A-like [Aristolochia californica]|uniref:E3 ubiquitin-protein ligase RHA2A-like n=1 Tax=Aristolochia californica TaxID=171875 RepID=UPI0035E3306C
MGLCSDLNDVSSDSIPLLLVALLANCVAFLRSVLCHFLQSMGISMSRFEQTEAVGGAELLGQVGSGLAGLIVLAEKLNVHQVFDFQEEGLELDCMVCLCRLREGEQVRKLGCSHVFHRGCLDGWFDLCNLNCPLCRAPLVSEDRIAGTERQLTGELVSSR